jgi:hypothetical protein
MNTTNTYKVWVRQIENRAGEGKLTKFTVKAQSAADAKWIIKRGLCWVTDGDGTQTRIGGYAIEGVWGAFGPIVEGV